MSCLKHPCIIRLLDMHLTNNIFYFVMEYASGGCLVDYVRKQVTIACRGQMPLPALKASAVLSAEGVAHSEGKP